MRLNEIFLNFSKFDEILSNLCDLVEAGREKNPKIYGLVGSAIIDPKNNIIKRTSRFREGKWSHAEREVILDYRDKFGDISKNTILITTLSPCNELHTDPAPSRRGESCTKLINTTGIKLVYSGYLDPSQGNNEYDERNFKLILSKDSKIRDRCKKYADQFLIKHKF